MILKDYVFWKQGVPSHVCDEIVKYGKNQLSIDAVVGAEGKNRKDKNVRDSKISWLKAPWIWDWINEPFHKANRDIFQYNLNNIEEAQFTTYSTNQFYEWHMDLEEDESTIVKKHCRKLSLIVALTDPSKYEGGELEIKSLNSSPEGQFNPPIISKDEFKEQGTIIIFPSYVWHRVKPVTKGTRHSLVAWSGGPLFT